MFNKYDLLLYFIPVAVLLIIIIKMRSNYEKLIKQYNTDIENSANTIEHLNRKLSEKHPNFTTIPASIYKPNYLIVVPVLPSLNTNIIQELAGSYAGFILESDYILVLQDITKQLDSVDTISIYEPIKRSGILSYSTTDYKISDGDFYFPIVEHWSYEYVEYVNTFGHRPANKEIDNRPDHIKTLMDTGHILIDSANNNTNIALLVSLVEVRYMDIVDDSDKSNTEEVFLI